MLTRFHTAKKYGGPALVCLAILGSVMLWARLARPLWFDEVCQFSLAGMSYEDAVVSVVRTTGSGFNFSQTGTFYLADWVLPHLMGVSTLSVRLPSILCAALLLASAALMFRALGFGVGWQLIVVLALASTSSLMYYAGEARHYMPLAAFAVATFAFYVRRAVGQLNRTTWALGILGLIVGSVWHPYWIVFTIAAVGFGYVAMRHEPVGGGREPLLRFATPALLVPAVVAYLAVGMFTWLKGAQPRGNNPFEYLVSSGEVVREFISGHLRLTQGNEVVAVLVVLASVGGLVLARAQWRAIEPPVTLMAVGIASSVLFIAVSYVREHWILGRQWTAGIALFVIGLTWLMASFWRLASAKWSDRALDVVVLRVIASSFAVWIAVSTVITVSTSRQDEAQWSQFWAAVQADQRTPQQVAAAAQTSDDWVYLANLNVQRGGQPWPEIAGLYGVRRGS